MLKTFSAAVILFVSFFTSAQSGKITGTVTTSSGEKLAFIYIVPYPAAGNNVVLTDLDGNYSIELKEGTYTISFRGTGYNSHEENAVGVTSGETKTLSVTLTEMSNTFDTVIVRAKAIDGSFTKVTEDQKNNAAASEVVGKQMIESRPTTSTSDVIKLASGASIQENRFAIVRGLNDRYNGAYLNGAPLPSTESDRKAFSFDIFPSNMLDNLSIIKTSTPDMPAEFAGGLIFITTKNIPEKDFYSVSTSGGYNTVTTGKEKVFYNGGKTDWIGIDDGTRSLSSAIPAAGNYPVKISEQAAMAKNLKNDWALNSGTFDPNMNFQFSMGKNFRKKIIADGKSTYKDRFGILVALTYNRTYNLIQTTRRSYTSSSDPVIPSQIENEYFDKAYSNQTLGGAIANFSWKLNENNSISFKNILSVNTDDRVISRTGNTNPLDVNPTLINANARWFTGNKIYSGQLQGDHQMKGKIKMSWVTSYSAVQRTIPNLRRSVYSRFQSVTDPSDPMPTDTMWVANISISTVSPDNGGGIFSATTNENIKGGRYDISKSFVWGAIKDDAVLGAKNKYKNSLELKSGFYTQQRHREFEARQLGVTRYQVAGGSTQFDFNLLYLPDDQIFSNEHMGLMSSGKAGFKLSDATKPTDKYSAQSTLNASYLMLDYRFKKFLRVVAGARYESFTQELHSKFDNGKPLDLNVKTNDILPSINTIFAPTDKQNIRLSYSQTLNRPEFRELAPFAFYDFNTQFLYSGNEKLKRALIHNFDLRYEFFPGRGQLFCATVFTKDFINPIEQVSRGDVQGEVYYANVPKAKNTGAEAEFRYILGVLFKKDSSKFLNNLTFYTNFAYIKSKVTLTNNENAGVRYRQLQGQSPYVFNAGFLYNDSKRGWSFSIAANRIGQRIAIVGNVNEPDIWENGRTVLDLQAGKTFKFYSFVKNSMNETEKKLKGKLEMKLSLRDGLAQKQYFFQDRNGNKKIDLKSDDIIWTTSYGRIGGISVSYTF
jgi:TonB-dependent receptor